ncbi:MAG: DUF3417 domain-containing protein, partial [Micrococcales bacterium]
DPVFLSNFNRVLSNYDTYHNEPLRRDGSEWLRSTDLVAYFCAEFGFHESLPIYSGGLGILFDAQLNKNSGLKGMTGLSDLRDIEAKAAGGDRRAIEAIEVYVQRIKHYLGAYIAELGGIDAVVFTAGVGENSAHIRSLVCSNLEWLGIELDSALNTVRSSEIRDLATSGSRVRILVVPTNEELEIAVQAAQLC